MRFRDWRTRLPEAQLYWCGHFSGSASDELLAGHLWLLEAFPFACA